ncbi:hypothetical protein OQA88_9075 [Cercophora sp. LCS_1]
MDAALLPTTRVLTHCLAHHASCRTRARLSTIWSSDNMHIIRDLGVKDLMPRRLLHILPNEAGIHLIELGSQADEVPFIALSYTWGSPTPKTLKTTKATLKSMVDNGLAMSELPATFVDAVNVTRAFGYEHLWIDALCIVQDDGEDWKREAPRMAVVYGNAVCTLHAVDSGSAEGGFVPGEEQTVEGVLDTRGWTTQEMAISPRSVLFGRDGIRWECREGSVVLHSSTVELERSVTIRANDLKSMFVFFRDWRPPGHEQDEEPSEEGCMDLSFGGFYDDEGYLPFFRVWWDFVSCYTARNLNFESDRFLAMNGIAAVAQRWARIRNSWGLWLDGLERELMWYVDTNPASSDDGKLHATDTRPQRTNKWLAPSWSWASVKGGAKIRNGVYDLSKEANDNLNKEDAVWPALMIKPEIGIPYGTSFDQSLPIPAWKSHESRSIQLSGDLRSGQVTANKIIRPDGTVSIRYDMEVDPVGRWSDQEKYDFRPDAADEFPEGQPVKVWCLLVHRLYAGSCGIPESVNLSLVLKQKGQETGVTTQPEYIKRSDMMAERTFTRVGYLETKYATMRDMDGVNEDFWWKVVWLL